MQDCFFTRQFRLHEFQPSRQSISYGNGCEAETLNSSYQVKVVSVDLSWGEETNKSGLCLTKVFCFSPCFGCFLWCHCTNLLLQSITELLVAFDNLCSVI